MKTIQMKEIVIDLTKSDHRSGKTTLAKILYRVCIKMGIEVEHKFTKEAEDKFPHHLLREIYEKQTEGTLQDFLEYCLKNKIAITIIPE